MLPLLNYLTIGAGIAVVAPALGKPSQTMPVAAAGESIDGGFRVIIGIPNAGAELDEQDRSAYGHNSYTVFIADFQGYGNVVCPSYWALWNLADAT